MSTTPIDELKIELRKEELVYAMDTKPGLMRQKIQKSYAYYDLDGKKVTDKKTKDRIDSLGIPPAWENVWISPLTNGHLQATGFDEKGRKQYIYHPSWIKISQENKFAKMVDFGMNLPKIRGKVAYDMRNDELSRKKIIATVIWLLEHTFIRIGNEQYSRENASFGLTTLRNRHAKVRGKEVTFHFTGKSGVENILTFSNPTVAKTIKKCIELPGFELFQYIDDDGTKHTIESSDVNEFLKEITDDTFTAKDFRTWGATNLSADIFYDTGDPEDSKTLKKNVKETIKQVSEHLNNTVSVCRSYYIHPSVIQTYEKKILLPFMKRHDGKKSDINGLSWRESALIKLLREHPL